MRRELGENAVIVDTRTLQADTGELVEILAVPEQELTTPTPSEVPPHDPLLLLQLQQELALLRQQVSSLEHLLRYTTTLPPVWQQLYHALQAEGFAEDFLLRRLPPTTTSASWKELLLHARQQLTSNIRTAELPRPARTPLRLLLLGAPGSGRTTALLKLLLLYRLLFRLPPFLIAADAQKLGALEYLQLFASIADIPLTEAYSPQEVRYALTQLPNTPGVVAIDIPGGNPFVLETQRLWQRYRDAITPDAFYAVVSATDSLPVLHKLLHLWKTLGVHGLIVTKLDQAPGIGPLLQALDGCQLPLICLCTGPTIPDDIEPATREALARWIAITADL